MSNRKIDKQYTFGTMLKNLRINKGLTQSELCGDFCSIKQLSRIENDLCEPSVSLLHSLSFVLNVDLNEYYREVYINKSHESSELNKRFNTFADTNDTAGIITLIPEMEASSEFETGYNHQLLLYARALVSTNKREFTQSFNICIESMHVTHPDFDSEKPIISIYTNVEYCLLNHMYFILTRLDDIRLQFIYATCIRDSVHKQYLSSGNLTYQSSTFAYKMYLNSLQDLSVYYFMVKDYNFCQKCVDEGIEFGFKNRFSMFLATFLSMKARAIYMLNPGISDELLAECRSYHSAACVLWKLQGKESMLKDMNTYVKQNFPDLLP